MIYSDAAEWLERLSGEKPDTVTARRFENWLNGDARRAAAMDRMLQTWCDPALAEAARRAGLPGTASRRRPLHWGGALAAAACLLVAVLLWQPEGGEGGVAPPVHLQTPVAELRQFELEDGSVLEMAAASELEVRLEERRRRVKLVRGAAYFAVAGDKRRPFEVRIGSASVVALGTEFNIEKSSAGTDVIVHEGAVEVRANAGAEPLVLRAGNRVRIDRRGISPAESVDLKRVVDWRSGWIEIRDESLAYLLERFARHSPEPIELADTRLAGLRVAGRFRLKDTEANLALLSRLYPLEVERRDGRILVRYSPE
ncbi:MULTISPECIES: FecR domain-containing protein [unclassified Microbulbifer]|uniref:FecR family protein n=1 Tax=unclassified Microbulbifer TaxID=2619833 RepID=UPI0027E4A3A6|nr:MULTISPECIES: FecR domain-containing protein [unclassified Microbulbifer]